MSVQSLQARLKPLSDALKQTQQLIGHLSKLPTQLGASPSNPDEGDARVELSAEIHQSLKEQEEDFELLRQEAEDQTNSLGWPSAARPRNSWKAREKTDLAAQVARLGEDLKIARIQFRKAQLTAKRKTETAKRKEREHLFAGIHDGNETPNPGTARRKGQEKQSQDEILLNASTDVTAALRRTHNLMSSELERSQFARETLENSTKDLNTLSESYTNLDTLLSSSRSLVSTLIHSQKSDTWYLESAFFILCATIGWLVFRRLIYGPGWWLLYFPLKLLWRLSLSAIQVVVGGLSIAAGAVRAKGQGTALERANAKVSVKGANIRTARGKVDIPTFESNMPAPSVRVGAGGQGAKADTPQGGDRSMSEQVGEMAEKGQQLPKDGREAEKQETVLREREEGETPNPKKRMWEEPAGDAASGSEPKDEL